MLAQSNKLDSQFMAKDFKLLGIDNKYYSLSNIKGSRGTLICFICNHCPYVKNIIHDLVKDTNELKDHGVSSIAIMPNDVEAYPKDSFDNMVLFSKNNSLNIPYLYDKKQSVAKAYNAVCTPDFYGFDNNLMLKYRGRINNSKMNYHSLFKRELFQAMVEVSKNKKVTNNIPSIGCSIKWK